MVEMENKIFDFLDFFVPRRGQADKFDPRIVRVRHSLNKAALGQAVQDNGCPAFGDFKPAGDFNAGEIFMPFEQHDTLEFGCRQIEHLGLKIDALLAAVVYVVDELLQFVALIFDERFIRILLFIVHDINYKCDGSVCQLKI